VHPFGETQDSGGAAAFAAHWPQSFDLGPTARTAGGWTRLRRRLEGARSEARPLFIGGAFDSGLVVEEAGALTQLRRSWDAAELPLPPVPRLSAPQLGTLLGVVVLTCAVTKPWGSIGTRAGADEGSLSAAAVSVGGAPSEISARRVAPRRPPPPPLASIEAKLVGTRAVLPAGAPEQLERVVAAANRISDMPYLYGGGHGSFESSGYDCSGAISYALNGGGMLSSPLDSSGFTGWGQPGEGKAITVYANAGHAYAVIAGLRWDTSGTGGSGPSWHRETRSPSGYVARHPSGY